MKRVVPLLALMSLCACNVQTASITGPTNTNQSVGGIWRGQMTTASGATVAGLMIVAQDGRFFSEVDNPAGHCADVAQGSIKSAGTGITGSDNIAIIDYTTVVGVQVDCAYTDGAVSGAATLTGSVAQGSTLTLVYEDTTAFGGALPRGTATLAFDPLYDESSSLAKIAGTWTLSTGATMTIGADGAIFSQDAANGCTLRGQVSLINPNVNAYSVSATYSDCGAGASALDGLAATGIATLNDQLSPNSLDMGYSLTLANAQVLIIGVHATN